MKSRQIDSPVLVRIHRVSRSLLRASMAYYLSEFGLGVPQVQILNTIGHRGPLMSKDIADDLAMNKALVSRTLTELTELGYTKEGSDPSDARRRVWTLTAKGDAFIAKWRPIRVERQKRFLKALTANEQKALVDILDRLYASSEKLRADETAMLARKRGAASR